MGKKICMVSSCGGHFMELMQLLPAVEGYNFYIVTEKNSSSVDILKKYKYYLLLQQDRNKTFKFVFRFAYNIIKSFIYLLRERPDIIITTGAGASFPTCKLGKMMGKKIIYVESFAKLTSRSLTGDKVYNFADYFFVQWPEMQKIYPNSEYYGTVY